MPRGVPILCSTGMLRSFDPYFRDFLGHLDPDFRDFLGHLDPHFSKIVHICIFNMFSSF